MNREDTKKIFVCIEKDINVNGTILKKHSVGIIENIGTKESKINFIWFKEPIIISNNDFKVFDPLKTGDLFHKKVCNVCHRLLDTEDFAKNQNGKGNRPIRRPSCEDCRKIIDGINASPKEKKEWEKNKPELEFFSCPICHKTTIPGLTSKIVLDHSHKDGHIRGWICDSCNTGIGRFKDDIILLENAIKFLKTD
jgi:RNase P subunit RPR2